MQSQEEYTDSFPEDRPSKVGLWIFKNAPSLIIKNQWHFSEANNLLIQPNMAFIL
uniref:Uncharacterized protein n=1 Tax=Anguilla anguilla TaxID=7936 RepID=A0A0E9VDP9_ANGAN